MHVLQGGSTARIAAALPLRRTLLSTPFPFLLKFETANYALHRNRHWQKAPRPAHVFLGGTGCGTACKSCGRGSVAQPPVPRPTGLLFFGFPPLSWLQLTAAPVPPASAISEEPCAPCHNPPATAPGVSALISGRFRWSLRCSSTSGRQNGTKKLQYHRLSSASCCCIAGSSFPCILDLSCP